MLKLIIIGWIIGIVQGGTEYTAGLLKMKAGREYS